MVLKINSIPIEMTINPIILDKAFIPEAPSALTIYRELTNNIKVIMLTNKMDVMSIILSVYIGFS